MKGWDLGKILPPGLGIIPDFVKMKGCEWGVMSEWT
jgi:hypothetical protein